MANKEEVKLDDLLGFDMARDVLGNGTLIGLTPSKANSSLIDKESHNVSESGLSAKGMVGKTDDSVKKDADWQYFTLVCSRNIVNKIKLLAAKEGFTIRSIVEKMLGDGLVAYESKHGTLEPANRDINDLY